MYFASRSRWRIVGKQKTMRLLSRERLHANNPVALLLQMTVQRAEAQAPTPTKLGALHAAAHKLRH
jgi:hypothetical protein